MKTYKSKIGIGLVLILVIIFGSVGYIIANTVYNLPPILVTSAFFVLYLFLSTYYTIENEILNVRSGFLINMKINVNSIYKIVKSNSIMSAPAASLDRLKITYQQNQIVVISPKNKQDFVNELKSINTKIEVDI